MVETPEFIPTIHTTTSSSSTAKSHINNSLSINKSSFKISKTMPNRNPSTSAAASTAAAAADIPPQQNQPSQPPVYNIDKNNFRDVVQKLTGSPAHRPMPPPPPAAAAAARPPISRLHRNRPPPLAAPRPEGAGGGAPPPPPPPPRRRYLVAPPAAIPAAAVPHRQRCRGVADHRLPAAATLGPAAVAAGDGCGAAAVAAGVWVCAVAAVGVSGPAVPDVAGVADGEPEVGGHVMGRGRVPV